MRCLKVEAIDYEDDLHDLEIEGGDGAYIVEGVVAHNSNFRVGFHGSRPFMVGSHTGRVLDSHLASSAWPRGHLMQKALLWVEQKWLRDRIDDYRSAHPDVTSLAIYGEICGWKCSDLHYGRTDIDQTVCAGSIRNRVRLR